MHRRALISASILFVFVAVACGTDVRSPAAPTPLPPLGASVWYAHLAAGQPLPAVVAERIVDGSLEQMVLDSARFTVAADGRWEQRLHLERFLETLPDGSALQEDAGSWVVTDSGYLFTSDQHGARFVVGGPVADSLAIALRVVGSDAVVGAVLRQTPTPPAPAGEWTAETLGDTPLPSRMFLWDPFVEGGREISIHLIVDSARLVLQSNGRYEHRTWASEWAGEVGGPPEQLRVRSYLWDQGGWARTGVQLRLDSWWLENHWLAGEFATDVLRMQHGLTHGEQSFPFRYVRKQ